MNFQAGSWMEPDAKKETLLYISWNSGVNVYSYPSNKLVGNLYGFITTGGLCSDKAGNVFVTDVEEQRVYEFAHGGTEPIATLYDNSNSLEFNAWGCSVDATTNKLAVTSLDSHYVWVFENETGTPTIYENPYALGYFCTYDGSGNLFMNGSAGHIAELARASNQFKNIKLSERLKDLVGFAWDGQHLSINSNAPGVVNYRIDANGGKATVISSVRLLGARWLYEFTLYKHQLIGPDISGYVYFWKYPKAAEPVKEIGYLQTPEGSAISLAP